MPNIIIITPGLYLFAMLAVWHVLSHEVYSPKVWTTIYFLKLQELSNVLKLNSNGLFTLYLHLRLLIIKNGLNQHIFL